jgi:hypothetical protein
MLAQDRVKWQVLVNKPLISRKVVTVIFSRRTVYCIGCAYIVNFVR